MTLKTKFLILMALNILAYTSIAVGASVRSSISMAPAMTVYPPEARFAIAIGWLFFSLPTAVFAVRRRRNLSRLLIAIALATLLFPIPCFSIHPYLCTVITSALR